MELHQVRKMLKRHTLSFQNKNNSKSLTKFFSNSLFQEWSLTAQILNRFS